MATPASKAVRDVIYLVLGLGAPPAPSTHTAAQSPSQSL